MLTAGDARAREWILLAASLGIALLLAEAVCRLALPRPGFVPRHGNWLPGAVRTHPTRLYGLTPGFSARISAGETFGTMHIDINADGLRERPLVGLRAADLRILAVGDCFTFGYGLEQGQVWPSRLEEELRRRLPASRSVAVINTGVPGYSLAQMEDMTREMLPKIVPQLVIVAVFAGGFGRLENPMTAIGDLMMSSAEIPVVRLVDGGVVRSPLYQPVLVNTDLWLKTHWYFGAFLFGGMYDLLDKTRGAFNTVVGREGGSVKKKDPLKGVPKGMEYLERIRKRAGEIGARVAVLIVNRFDPDHRANREERMAAVAVREYCLTAGIPFIDPTDMLEAADVPLRVRPANYHWSAEANDLAARQLAGYLLEMGLIGESS